MNREEVRDPVLAPVLQWTRLGRQFNQGMLASMEVITQRSYGLLRGHTSGDGHDWEEMALMTREKVAVPLEGLAAMASALPGEVASFWTRTGEAMAACAGSAMSLAASRSVEDLRERQADLGEALVGSALAWYALFGSAATLTDAALAPLIRQVKDNAERLG